MTMPKHIRDKMEMSRKDLMDNAIQQILSERFSLQAFGHVFAKGFTAMYEIAAERERKLIKLLKDIQELGFVTYPSDLRSYFRGSENPVYIKAMDYNKRKDNIVSELDQVLKELESG